MPEDSPLSKHKGEARRVLAKIAKLTAQIQRHPQLIEERVDQYERARELGVTFEDIAVMADCTNPAVQAAVKKRRERGTA